MSKAVIDLSRVVVRLVADGCEEDQWNEAMVRDHYLGSCRMGGEQLKYVALYNGYPVAYLGWSGAVQKLSDREDWIGWSPVQKRQRLNLVAQNARFLILPGFEVANLASKVLSLNLKVLSADWERRYGHPIWLVETFVEEGRNKGTCYLACGWEEVGKSKGFSRIPNGYRKNGIVKLYFAKELLQNAKKKLKTQDPLPEDHGIGRLELAAQAVEGSKDGKQVGLFEIIEKNVEDPRNLKGRSYSLVSIFALVLTGLLAGHQKIEHIAEWGRTLRHHECRRLKFKRRSGSNFKMPSANTIRYILQDVKPEQLETALSLWIAANGINTTKTHIALDGKVLCGSNSGTDQPQCAQVTAYHVDKKIVIEQSSIPSIGHEKTYTRDIVDRMDLSNSIITSDAGNINAETTKKIVEKGGSIFFQSKETNRNLKLPSKIRLQRQASPQMLQNITVIMADKNVEHLKQ
jgi:hypothetical protein